MFGLKSGQRPIKEQSEYKKRPYLDSSCPKIPITTYCLTIIDGFELSSIACVQNLNYLPLVKEETTAELLALGFSFSSLIAGNKSLLVKGHPGMSSKCSSQAVAREQFIRLTLRSALQETNKSMLQFSYTLKL